VTRRGLEPRTPCLKDRSRRSRKVVPDKDFRYLGFLREGQHWTRLARLTPDLATGEQQALWFISLRFPLHA
jgi:hypothetical protein